MQSFFKDNGYLIIPKILSGELLDFIGIHAYNRARIEGINPIDNQVPNTPSFSNDKLEEVNQILVKQLKNRYGDPTINKKFLVGLDRAKMKLIDLGDKSQSDLVDTGKEEKKEDDTPVFDTSTKKNKKDFGEFKFEWW